MTIEQHGTRTEYQRGCDCDACRAANAEYVRLYRQRNPDRERANSYARAYRAANPERVRGHCRAYAARRKAAA